LAAPPIGRVIQAAEASEPMTAQRCRRRCGYLAMLTMLGIGWTAVHGAESYRVRLTTVPIETRTSADVKGSGSATAELDGTRLTIHGSFSGFMSPATGGELHAGSVTAVRGPRIAEFAVPQDRSGSFSATIVLTPEHVQGLSEGRLYIQIVSAGAPDGNVWGWLLK
jgi:hypothetical protein